MRGLEHLRTLDTDTADGAGVSLDRLERVAKVLVEHRTVAKRPTADRGAQPKPGLLDITDPVDDGDGELAVAVEDEPELLDILRGAGARRDGKGWVLDLGHAGKVTYLTHGEFVAKAERGELTVLGDDPQEIVNRLGISFPSSRETA